MQPLHPYEEQEQKETEHELAPLSLQALNQPRRFELREPDGRVYAMHCTPAELDSELSFWSVRRTSDGPTDGMSTLREELVEVTISSECGQLMQRKLRRFTEVPMTPAQRRLWQLGASSAAAAQACRPQLEA